MKSKLDKWLERKYKKSACYPDPMAYSWLVACWEAATRNAKRTMNNRKKI